MSHEHEDHALAAFLTALERFERMLRDAPVVAGDDDEEAA